MRCGGAEPSDVPSIEHAAALSALPLGTVIDVGANKGQFAAFAQHAWPAAQLICFEPLAGPRARLAAVTGGRARIHAVALGGVDGEAVMHVASREDSSSLLQLGEMQKTLFSMDEVGQVTVPVRRLDTVLSETDLQARTLLKIDVQGFEYEVLQGAARSLENIDAVYVECSLVELYRGQKLAADVAALLEARGFEESGRFNLSRKNGRDIQADLLFVRT